MNKHKHLPLLIALLLVLALVLAVLLLLPSAPTQENPLGAAPGATGAPATRNPAPVAITKVTDAAGRAYVIVIETTDAGRALPAPTRDKPVYYIAHSVGQRDSGDAYGGAKLTPYSSLQKQFDRILASSHYRPADPAGAEHPPTQLLIRAWGMHNKIETPGIDSSGDDLIGNPGIGADGQDTMLLLTRAKVVGGRKFADEFAAALAGQPGAAGRESNGPLPRFSARDDITKTLVHHVFNDCHYLLVTAYDIKDVEAYQRKEIRAMRPLWTVHISTVP